MAAWSDDHAPLVKALAGEPDLSSLRDVALRFNVEQLAALVRPDEVPAATPGATADEKKRNFAVALNRKLFAAQPTAVLQRMVRDAEIPIADTSVRAGVGKLPGQSTRF